MDGYAYILELVDQISGPAKTIGQQVDALTGKLKDDAKAINDLRAKHDDLRKVGVVTLQQEKDMAAEMAKATAAADKDTAAIRRLVDQEAKRIKSLNETVAAEKEAAASASSLSNTWEALGPYAMAAAGAFLAIGAAVGALVLGGAKIALDAGAFKNKTTAALESAVGTREAASAAFEEIRAISDEVGIADERAQKMGLALLDAGVERNDVGDTIRSIAMLEKVRGQEVANKIQEAVKKSAAAGTFKLEGEALAGSGIGQDDVVAALAARLGKSTAQIEDELKKGKIAASDGIAALNEALGKENLGAMKGLSSLGDITGKLWEQFTRLFEDVDTGPFLDAVKEIGGLFSSSTVTGAALREIITKVFSVFFQLASDAMPYVKVVLNEIIIVALKLYIAAKPLIAQFQELFGAGDSDTISQVLIVIVDVVIGLAAALVIVVGSILAFQLALTAAAVYAVVLVTDLGTAITDSLGAAWDWLTGIFSAEGGGSLAGNLIAGLIGGITGGASQVVAAMTNLGQGAIDSVKNVLGIASPSKVMAEMGGYTAEGFAQGAQDGAGEAQSALASVVAPPAAPAAGGDGGGRSVQITVMPGAFAVPAGTASEMIAALEAQLGDMLDSIALQLGASAS